MDPYSETAVGEEDYPSQILWKDDERVFCRTWRRGPGGDRRTYIVVFPASERPATVSVDRLAHEYDLKDQLDPAWAVRPLELVRDRTMLVLDDPGGELLDGHLTEPIEPARFLQLAIDIAAALRQVHQCGLVHRDLKPAHILVDGEDGHVRLTGFGLASRLLRERQLPGPPEFIAGTLAYMAPEQTGRMNRSIDSRSDLYALGVIFYQMLTGVLPFTASDPMEWVHCHIARTPTPPQQRVANIPDTISRIVMKLLAKTAEERYQTAAGLERDLRRCLAEWQARGRIDPFSPGEADSPDRLSIPEKLYGRAREIETLLGAFDRVVAGGRPELVLVSGYSGIGKSAVVNELHKALVPRRGLFASGKFDQHKREIPYATIAQAFQGLVRPLLGMSEAELHDWRRQLGDALGPNGLLIQNLVPELKFIMGDQPPVPDLPLAHAKARFEQVARRFIGVFASAEHPLALFLDDLQWLDTATLDLLEDLLTQPDMRHLILIGAYRGNEVDASHPLMRKLDAMRNGGSIIQEIKLAPLTHEDLGTLLADALRCAPELAAPLAHLVRVKTGGNPFFAIQFISALVDEGLLVFGQSQGRWSWDLGRIQAKGYTDNVVDLMVGKLNRLPLETQQILKEFACLGNNAEFATLAIVHETSEEEVHSDLWEALRLEFVVRLESSYKFIHDRIQEAAYSLIPEPLRDRAHLRIGRLLAARTPAEKQEEAIFEIVSQLNRGAALITSGDEREQVAELSLLAGQRAKAKAAYASALSYLAAGAALLPTDSWERRHELAFALESQRAECEFLTGEMTSATERLNMLSSRAADTVERATVACLHMDLFTTLNQIDRAIAVCLAYLRHLGIEWPPHPADADVRREYDRVWSHLGSREIEALADLPLMGDPASRATLDVLTTAITPAVFTDVNLLSMVVCRAVNLSLESGNSDGSCNAYVWLGVIAGPQFDDYKAGFRFGRLGLDLIEKRDLKRFQARTRMIFVARIMHWTKHVGAGGDLLREAYEDARKTGDLPYAAYTCDALNRNLLAAGEPLADVQRQAEDGLAFAQKAGFGLATDLLAVDLRLIRTLRGLTARFGAFDDGEFDEQRFERRLAGQPASMPECRYWIRTLQARFIAGHYASALDASLKAQRLLWTSFSTFELVEYHFYSALSRAASYGSTPPGRRRHHLEALQVHHRRLEIWSENCPENFETRAALVSAEIARIEGRDLDAERLYEQAISSARANGFVHNEALANELAARFYLARGFEKIAHTYLQDARYGYLRWGADGKVRQLDALYPQIGKEGPLPGPTGTIEAPIEHLDLATVIKVSQAVSGEIVLDKLLDRLLRTALEHAGAERGLLVLTRGTERRIAAESSPAGDTVTVLLRDDAVTAAALPELVLHYVLHTQEAVILDDAVAQEPYAADPYIRERKARSILCLPLITQAKLIGVLYLENKLTARAFAPARIAVLKLLASQAAIALENARLYSDVAEREARIRRLVDANIIGTFIWKAAGSSIDANDVLIVEANDAFLRMVGYDREDLVARRLSRATLTPPEWHERDTQTVAEVKMSGTALPFEKEYFRKDGSRVPVLVGFAAFDKQMRQGVAFVIDLTDRKRAEVEAREAQMELVHANRVAAMGQLSASIVHEINQPLSGVITSAETGLLWLKTEPPNMRETIAAFSRVVRDGKRASEVVNRIRALIKKAPPQKDNLDINEAILEVIGLTRAEATKNGVSIQTHLEEDLPRIQGDRIQLQQVVLNLVMNGVEALRNLEAGPREILIDTAMTESDGVLVAVRDTGPGLDPAKIERIFDAFYTTKAGGLGMGLSICRSIVEAHGGKLWANPGVPQGAVFQFALPIEQVTH